MYSGASHVFKYWIQSIPVLLYPVVFDIEPIIINKMEVPNYIL